MMLKNLQPRFDKRCVKTKSAIRKALAAIMTDTDVSRITVKKISKVADINRKTFYTHYTDVYDILDEIEDEMIVSLSETVRQSDFSKLRFDPYQIFDRLTVLVNADFGFYRSMLQTGAYSNFFNKIKDLLKESLLGRLPDEYKKNQTALTTSVEFIAAGAISAYRQWFNSDRTQSLEEISNTIGALAISGLDNLKSADRIV